MANEFIARKGIISLDGAQVTGSLSVTGNISASIFTGSFRGDGSQLTGVSAGFPFTGSAGITGSLTVVGPVNATTFTGDGSQLTGIEGFPFTGSARITGSLTVVGPVNATSFTGSLQGIATSASYVQLANVDGFTVYSASVNTTITPQTATVNTGSSPLTLTTQSIVIADSTNGNLIVNLPDLNTVIGTPNQKPIIVYKNDYSQNVIYVNPSGSQLVNGASQDIIVSIQLAVIYNPTSAGWVTEGTSAQSLAELELFFLPLTETGSLATTGSNTFRGNQIVTGSLTVTGNITGNITGSATSASYVEYTNVANKPTLVSGSAQVTYSGLTGVPAGIVSGSSQVTYSGLTGVPSGIVSSSTQIGGYGIFATTGSNQFNGSQAITGSLTVTGQVVAQTLNVQQVTSSIVYSSGSNIFGNSLGNTQQFTGSVSVTGSLTSNGALSGTSAVFSGNVSLNTSNIILGLGNGANNESIVLSYNSNASSRSWRIIKDWTAFGDFQIQQSTTQTGTTYADILRFSPAGTATFSTNSNSTIVNTFQNTNTTNTNSRNMLNVTAGNVTLQLTAIHGDNIYISPSTAVSTYIGYNNTVQIASTGAATFNTSTATTSISMLSTGTASGLRLQNTGGTAADWIIQSDGGVVAGQAALRFYSITATAYRMSIDGSGNVGIGTTSPSATEWNASSTLLHIYQNSTNGAVLKLESSNASGIVGVGNNAMALGTTTDDPLLLYTNITERMRITSGGYLKLKTVSSVLTTTTHRLDDYQLAQGSTVLVSGNAYNADSIILYSVDSGGANAAATALAVGKHSSTNRSINAGGSINASGADYAEYMVKAITDNIAKGDIVGVNSEGKLTNIFNDAISFAVKSTDPAYVGNDSWGSVGSLNKPISLYTEEELQQYKATNEAIRATVDRIAFSGQVPCNVTGSNVGDYIIPIELENGKIGGQAVTTPTFQQYQISVGKVWKIMEDGRAWIAVKIG